MIRVAVAAPARARCGISDYTRLLADAYPSDVQIHHIPFPSCSSPKAWRSVASITDEFDVVHVNYEYSFFHTIKPYRNRFATFMRRLRPPAVVTAHAALPKLIPRWQTTTRYRLYDFLRDMAYLPFFGTWETAEYKRGRHWVVHTAELAAQLAKTVGVDHVSYTLHPVPECCHQWSYRASDRFLFVTPGFIKPHKGYESLIPVLTAHRKRRWILAGGPQNQADEQYLEELRTRWRQSGVDSRVEVGGYLPRAELEAAACRGVIAVFPFRWVSGSATLSWAAGLGIPIVATDLSPVLEMKKAGAGIELLPFGSEMLWPSIIENLVGDRERLERLSRQNHEYARRHSYRALSSTMTKIFRETTGGKTREQDP